MTPDEKTRFIGRGMVDVVKDYAPWLRWADLIFVADNTKYLRDLDRFRENYQNARIVGPSVAAANLELNRVEGMRVLRRAGVECPEYKVFSDYDKAISYVAKHGDRLVSKPSGDADKALTYVSKTPADMIYMLKRWKRDSKLKREFILQDFVEGIEMAVGGWFGPGGWNKGWCENFEFKKLMNGDLGVNTGEQGTVLRYVTRSKLADQVLAPLSAALTKLDYVGYCDVNCIIDSKGKAWPLELTMRPGWPTFNIQLRLHDEPVEWLWNLTNGMDTPSISAGAVALGVVMSIPDYPYSRSTRKNTVGVPVYGPLDWEWAAPCEMMMAPAPDLKSPLDVKDSPATAGDYVLVATAVGTTVSAANAMALGRLNKLTTPGSPMWRTDIGRRLQRQLPVLQHMGYATNLKF